MPLNPDVNLQEHQRRIADRAATAAEAGDPFRMAAIWTPGSGKSLAALAAAEKLSPEGYTAVVPAALRPNYRKEIERFTDQTTPVEVISYNQLGRGYRPKYPDTVVLDEVQRIRSPESSQAAAARDLADRAKNVIALTGTPLVNRPGDLAVLTQALTRKPYDPKSFEEEYVGTKRKRPGGLLGWLRGVPPVEEPSVRHADELRSLLAGHVDYHETGIPPVGFPSSVKTEDVPVEMSSRQADLYRAMMGRLPFVLKWKLRFHYPLSDDELRRARSFLTGPRQVALSTAPWRQDNNDLAAFHESGKLTRAFDLLKHQLDSHPESKAIVFSNFPRAGLRPYSAKLKAEGIPHATFDGKLSDQERKDLVNAYNSGKIRVALLGPAASEGISLRGTQLLQLLDEHFHKSRIVQAQARGIRFDSHLGLPKDLSGVKVQRFLAKLPLGLRDRMFQSLGLNRDRQRETVDDYLRGLSEAKARRNQVFMDLLKDIGTPKAAVDLTPAETIEILQEIKKSDNRILAMTRAVMTTNKHAAEKINLGDARRLEELGRMVPELVKTAQFSDPIKPPSLPKPPGPAPLPAPGIALPEPGAEAVPPPTPCQMGSWPPKMTAKAADYAPGIPSKQNVGDHTHLPTNQLIRFLTQEHRARLAGLHTDLRIGTPETGLFSWATKKDLPRPGGRPIAIYRQPLHSYEYGDFQGRIPSGYGAGTVRTKDKGEALVSKVTPDEIHLSTAHTGDPIRYLFKATNDPKRWLLINTTPTAKEGPHDTKVHYKSIPAEKAEEVLNALPPGSVVQPKVDGSASYVVIEPGKFEVFSYRSHGAHHPLLAGQPITHTERLVGSRRFVNTPKDLPGTVLRGEIFGQRPSGHAVEPQETGGLLNAGLAKSLRAQQDREVQLKNMIFDIRRLGKKRIGMDVPYPERLQMAKDVVHRAGLPVDKFIFPEQATTPAAAVQMWRDVVGGKNRLTDEGVVIHPSTGVPQKIKSHEEHDVIIRGVEPGEGKYKGIGAGAFTYSFDPTGRIIGRVGGGLSDVTRKQLWENPDEFVGRTARVRAQEQFPGGPLRAPRLLAFHEDVSPVKTAAAHPALGALLAAKAYSDAGDYDKKTKIMRMLMTAAPYDWYVDSDQGYTVGVTHSPTKFKLHVPRHQIADLIPNFGVPPVDNRISPGQLAQV